MWWAVWASPWAPLRWTHVLGGRADGCVSATVVLCGPVVGRTRRRRWDRLLGLRAIGSVVEHSLHTRGVTGSNPVSPTEVDGRGVVAARWPDHGRVHEPTPKEATGGDNRPGRARRRPYGGRRADQRRVARPGHAGHRRRRRRGRGHRHPRGPGGPAPLRRARSRAGGPAGVPGGPPGRRPADHGRVLLRLRRPRAVHPRAPGRPREAHGRDHQVRPAVRAARRRRRRGAPGTGRRAVQAAPAGQRGRRGGHGGRRRGADDLRERRPRRGAVLAGPVPGPARARHPVHPGERGQAHAHVGGLLAGRPGQRAVAAHLRHGRRRTR